MASSTSLTDTPPSGVSSGLDRWFEITARGSSVGREIRGGLVTFFTMAYIIVLNPIILGRAPDKFGNLIIGLPAEGPGAEAAADASVAAVAVATAVVAGVMTILMGGVGRFPAAIAAGLGLNSIVAFQVAMMVGWPAAMGFVFWEGVIVLVLVVTGFRRAVLAAVPRPIRSAISVGIGLFIAFVGLADAHVVTQAGGTPVQLGIDGKLQSWPTAIFVVVLFLLIALWVRKVKGAMLIAIVAGTVLAIVLQAALNLPSSGVDPGGWALNIPALQAYAPLDFSLFTVPFTNPTDFFFGAFTQTDGAVVSAILVILSLMLADFFDTMGTVVAVGAEGGLLEEGGYPKRVQSILLIDSVAAVAGGLGSTSSNTLYIESASGVGDGARTGLASIATGLAFLLTLAIAPFVNMVPFEAATPALFFVGCLMMAQVTEIKWADIEEALPAFAAIALMPFTYSITNGIGAGFLVYCFVKVVRGKVKEVHPLLWVVSAMFVIYFGQGLITYLLG